MIYNHTKHLSRSLCLKCSLGRTHQEEFISALLRTISENAKAETYKHLKAHGLPRLVVAVDLWLGS